MNKIGTNIDDTKLRTIAYAMERLGCSRSKIYRLASEHRLEMVTFDKRSRITDRSLRKLMTKIMEGNGS